MNKKDDVEKYLKNLYEFYKKSNFKYFVEKCLSFNVRIGDYNKDISSLSNKVYNLLLNNVIPGNGNINYCETDSYYQIYIFKKEIEDFDMNIIVDIPVFDDNYEKVSLILFNFLYSNEINFKMRFYKKFKNVFLKIIFDNVRDCSAFVDYYSNSIEIGKEIMSRVLPFVNYRNLGIYTEFYPFSFKNFFIKTLYDYFGTVKEDIILLDDFYKYNYSMFRLENDVNKKRMFKFLYQYINIINTDGNVFDLFTFKCDMNISSFDSDCYVLKISDDKGLYFINSFDNTIIEYGSIDFLNICYSKYYNIIIKKNNSKKFYFKFYNVYNQLISENYNNYKLIFSLLDDKMDLINRYLVIFSSAFFAYKEFSISEKEIFKFLDLIIDDIKLNV